MDRTLLAIIIFAVALALFSLIWYLIDVSKKKKDEPLVCKECGSKDLDFESHCSVDVDDDDSIDHFTYTCRKCGNKVTQIS